MESKTKILIAEDEFIIAMDIKKILEKLGYQVTSFVGKGADAISKAEIEKPDLVLMDIMLSGPISGIEAAEVIKNKFHIPVVYLTALTDDETLQKAKITEPGAYLLKPFDQRGLHSAIEIALYKYKMETQLKLKTKELEEEKIRTDELLHHILPGEIIKELNANGVITPRHYDSVTILFTDFQGFSQITNSLPPAELVKELNEIFSSFDVIIEKYELEKLKSIGDTYMICGGLPEEINNHAVRVISAAKEMINYLNERNKNSKVNWKLRAGINTGAVVAGIVGSDKFTYDVWGDAVNIASRMENSSDAGKINISGSTYNLVKDYFNCEYRGKLSVKGKGEVDMYYVKEEKA
ncbi:MAG: response regulator [Bacteroidetes bacterium]|nr:response regulator [Bacteroidota bacterium]